MSFSEFYQRSINEPEQFWAEQARRIDWQTPFTQTLDHSNPPFARWFCEGRTNLCHNAIDRWLEKQPEALALIAVSSETEEERTFTFRQLHDEVNAVASMLRSLGVQRGDRVLVYMPTKYTSLIVPFSFSIISTNFSTLNSDACIFKYLLS